MPKILITTLFSLLAAPPVFADDGTAPASPMRWLSFGLVERLTFRDNHPNANYSTMLQWQPRYALGEILSVGVDLGIAPMKQVNDNFVGFRYNAAAELFPDWLVHPEFIVGAESWTTPGGFTSAVFGGNAVVRTKFYFLSHAHLGFHWVQSRDFASRQVNIGLRFAF